jgi:hypothetical protein
VTTSAADPVPEPILRCAPWTQAQGVDPIGSATRFDALLLVAWPLPWPADVADIPELAGAAADGRARVMTVVPQDGAAPDAGGSLVVHRRRTASHHLTGVDHQVPHDQVPALVERLLDAVDDDTSGWPSAVGPAPAEVLVCAHGRRDPCCGRQGTLLHIELAERWPDVRTWRCSHTGGHRFAPTAITLPDGRSWAYVDPDLLDGIVGRSAPVDGLRSHDRGTGALASWAQPVERAVFGHLGWSWLDHHLTHVDVQEADGGDRARVELRWRSSDGAVGGARGVVEVTRRLPVLVCGEPPEAARKTSPELALHDLELF